MFKNCKLRVFVLRDYEFICASCGMTDAHIKYIHFLRTIPSKPIKGKSRPISMNLRAGRTLLSISSSLL